MAGAKLSYLAIASLDGYVADAHGAFDWAAPSESVHQFVNDRERSVGTYLYGRRMYDVMKYWADADTGADRSPVSAEYRDIWQRADKIVYSRTLTTVVTPRTRLEPQFDTAAVRALKTQSPAELSIGGPTLAGEALRAGLVDEVALLLLPVSVGGGTPALPRDQRLDLRLREQKVIEDVIFVRYDVRTDAV